MHIQLTKPNLIVIAVLTAILILGFMATAVSADTSMNVTTNNCNCDCNTMNMQPSSPACCSMADSSFPDCSLSEVPYDEAILPCRSTLNWDIQKSMFVESVSTEIDTNLSQFPEQETPPLLPFYLCSEYRCRSSLDSEDPYLN